MLASFSLFLLVGGGGSVIFSFGQEGECQKTQYDVRGYEKIFPLKKYLFPPATPPPSPAAVYMLNAAPGLYHNINIILSKGKLFNKGFGYLHNDVDSNYPKKIKFFCFFNSLLSKQLKAIKVTFNLTNLSS